MAIYDRLGNKIGRNHPCPCGSGKKFKVCHGLIEGGFADKVSQDFADMKAQRAAFEEAHGKVKPIISTEFKEWRFTAVGSQLHYSVREKTRYFSDFLSNYLRTLLSAEWGNAEIAKQLSDRHPVLKWYDSVCRYQRLQKQTEDGHYQAEPNGAMLSWYRLAYDLYLIRHNAKLQDNLLNRLKHKDQFQGARFELCVTAAMIVAGYEIDYEDETDVMRKHTEFRAIHPSGLQISVEAKSRHRDGILDFKAPMQNNGHNPTERVAVERILRNAISKKPGIPYFVFVDVNLPSFEGSPETHPWFREMSETVQKLQNQWEPGTFPVNTVFFCSDPTYYALDDLPTGFNFWCYPITIDRAQHALTDDRTTEVVQAMFRRANIPNEFPSS